MRAQIVFTIAIGILVAASFGLLVTNKRVLIWQTKVNPGDSYVVEEHGNVGASEQSSLVCRYFTGRSIKMTVLWYSSNNVLGREQCPFLASGE